MRTNILLLLILFCLVASSKASNKESVTFFNAGNPNFQYVGRIDFSNPELPRFWSPGVTVRAKFKGTSCEIQVNDEVMWGKSHNYITVVIDNQQPQRIKLKEKENKLMVAENLDKGSHTLIICKGTEAGIGYLEFAGISVKQLLNPDPLPNRRIEFLGNSITCGTGSDISVFPCGKGEWYDQHNAYMSYSQVTARLLNAQCVQTSVSGIGLTHSCCNMDRIMPDVIDKMNFDKKNSAQWDFSKYRPDVVSVMLGQNDGIQDSAVFCTAYINFINRLRSYYPKATIVCVTSPMADEKLVAFMKKSLNAVVAKMNQNGDANVFRFFFSKRFNHGCGDHPNLAEHAEIAQELSGFIREIKNW